MSTFFSTDELVQLRAHGIEIFAERVIFDAQPPISARDLAAVQQQCAGPLPESLIALWQQTAGGSLDYDLHLDINDGEESVHWCDLFWSGAEKERDLQRWIAHEFTTGLQPTPLHALPFGGFEYADRIYAVVIPGAQHGHILAWKQGLPEAWPHAMHEDGVATVATDLYDAFGVLYLSEDPLSSSAHDYFTGQALLDYLDERHGNHHLSIELMDKLIAFYRRALIDWQSPLAQGTLAQLPRHAQAALRHAIATDDAALMQELVSAGVNLGKPLRGTANATDIALGQGAHAAAQVLLDAGAPVHADALDAIENPISPELATALLTRGAEPSAAAIVQCVACGAPDAARLIGRAYKDKHDDLPQAFDSARNALLTQLQAMADEVRSGKLEHHLRLEGLIERIEHLQNFNP